MIQTLKSDKSKPLAVENYSRDISRDVYWNLCCWSCMIVISMKYLYKNTIDKNLKLRYEGNSTLMEGESFADMIYISYIIKTHPTPTNQKKKLCGGAECTESNLGGFCRSTCSLHWEITIYTFFFRLLLCENECLLYYIYASYLHHLPLKYISRNWLIVISHLPPQ